MNTAWLKKVAGHTEEVAGRPLLFVLPCCSRKGTKQKQSISRRCMSILPLLLIKQIKGGVYLMRKPSIDANSLRDDL
ncbi:hypothetical protein CsSME_00010699 [Camellia sinensis var. sinensis]